MTDQEFVAKLSNAVFFCNRMVTTNGKECDYNEVHKDGDDIVIKHGYETVSFGRYCIMFAHVTLVKDKEGFWKIRSKKIPRDDFRYIFPGSWGKGTVLTDREIIGRYQ